jgi:hypothetical protein
MAKVFAVLFLLSSFHITFWDNIKWKNDHQVFIEDLGRVISYHDRSVKANPVYNGDLKIPDIWCFVSNDGKVIVTRKDGVKLEIIKDRKVVYRSSIAEILKLDVKKEIDDYYRKVEHVLGFQRFLVFKPDEQYITLCLIHFCVDASYPKFFIKLDYKNNKIVKISETEGFRGTHCHTMPVSCSETGEQLFAIISLLTYFDFADGEEKGLFTEKFANEMIKKPDYGYHGAFGDKIYLKWNKTIRSYNIKTRELATLPLPANVTSCKYKKVIITKKYLYVAGFKDEEREKVLFEKLFRMNNFKEVKYSRFAEIRKNKWEIASFSPSGNRIFVQDKLRNNAYFFDLPK